VGLVIDASKLEDPVSFYIQGTLVLRQFDQLRAFGEQVALQSEAHLRADGYGVPPAKRVAGKKINSES